MNTQQKDDILQSMINFIQQHGKERVAEIRDQANSDFTVVKEKTIEAEKKRLMDQYEKDVNIAEVNLKIARSAEMNRARILKMRKTNEIVESLLRASKLKMAEQLEADRDSY
jgi:hypothetical protein